MRVSLPTTVHQDMTRFVNMMPEEAPDLRVLGVGTRTIESIADDLRAIYGLGGR